VDLDRGRPGRIFKVDLAFRLDTLSAVMILIVTGVGTLIHIYSTGYMQRGAALRARTSAT
jgi:NADH:ubiquinone oxidoreductase subunit 5 (subunit L)/multisubunit Na+/H+ antiporter MnhA subunit